MESSAPPKEACKGLTFGLSAYFFLHIHVSEIVTLLSEPGWGTGQIDVPAEGGRGCASPNVSGYWI